MWKDIISRIRDRNAAFFSFLASDYGYQAMVEGPFWVLLKLGLFFGVSYLDIEFGFDFTDLEFGLINYYRAVALETKWKLYYVRVTPKGESRMRNFIFNLIYNYFFH